VTVILIPGIGEGPGAGNRIAGLDLCPPPLWGRTLGLEKITGHGATGAPPVLENGDVLHNENIEIIDVGNKFKN